MIRAVLLASLAGLLAGCLGNDEPTEAVQVTRVVDIAEAQAAQPFRVTRLSGQVVAAEETTLSFETSGVIEQLGIDVGDEFARGDVLSRMDDSRYILDLRRAEAETQRISAALDEARQNSRRLSQLGDRSFASGSQLDTARAQVATLEAEYAAAQASRRLAERDLERIELKAPFNGIVSKRMVDASEQVAAGQPVLHIQSLEGGYEIHTRVSETLINQLEPGSHHAVAIPQISAETFAGEIVRVGSEPLSSNNYPVILTLQGPITGLRAGMTAKILFRSSIPSLNTKPDAVELPMTAVSYDGDGAPYVLRMNPQRVLEKVAVELVDFSDTRATICCGVQPGDQVVARGVEFVSADDQVQPLNAGPERYN